ncbi:hypothetical protein SLEP1_g321 [Rubroshorea leprosula]|uniref:Uncharacterized protein n=1 Tax=Rubroshorea leprosula TaxID=152421 RepID=A0AAV5HAB0_9ROSI|nr:hypothetical protein SLEP1_g321 [Rubroshorea leprosula]
MIVPCWQEIELAVDRESRVDNRTDKHPLYISSLADFEAPNLPFSELTHNGTTFSSRNYTFSVSSNIPFFCPVSLFLGVVSFIANSLTFEGIKLKLQILPDGEKPCCRTSFIHRSSSPL